VYKQNTLASKNRNLFRLTRFILLKLPLLFRFFAKFRSPKKRLLIIKTDAIGDYILFRNFIEIVSQSEKYKDHRVDLLGNVLWKDIALKYDSGFVNEFMFIRAEELYYAPLKTFKLAWQLFKKNYQIVLQPTYSRTFIIDGLAGFTAAKQIIGFESDTERILAKYKAETDRLYTQKLLLPLNVSFEFERSKFFFESVLNGEVSVNTPFIKTDNTDKHGIVIVPSAGILKRYWEAEKFVGLIKLILQHTSQIIYIEGNPLKIQLEDYLAEEIRSNRVVNLIGKTSLLQLIDLIGNAALVIANETSAVHIAAATKTKSVCILGGGHFGRFVPYPEYFESRPLTVYHKMDCYFCNWNCKFVTDEDEPYPCIGNVSLEAVWQSVQPLL
jgi:ADP-heptose:LPS heptosyltransferase